VDLSVVIPVFNEADGIAALIDEVCSALDGRLEFEVLVVDDGSDDGTAVALQACRARCPRLRVLRHRQRCGQSAALVSGVSAARAGCIATLDGDGQNDPADIMQLFRELERSPDGIGLIAGFRQQRRDSRLKRLSSRVANAVRRAVLGDGTPDTGCGLKLFPRAVFLALPQFDHMHRFLPALVQRAGGEVLSVAVSHRPRRHGVSSYGVLDRLWVGIVDLFGVWWLSRRAMRPVVSEVE
jgi:dolichol-phosphate mannosyltransferase